LQEDLFAAEMSTTNPADDVTEEHPFPEEPTARQGWPPGMDVEHDQHGRGWVWGSGLGRVTVRFETRETPPGSVRTFAYDDPALHRVELF
jgi:DNA polymerase IV